MMLCDELKPLIFSISDLAYVDEIRVSKNFQNPHDHAVYKATEVDAAIAELKAKLESVQATAYAESVDAGMENRKLKRALYKACVNWMTNRQCAMRCFDLEERAKKFDKAIAKCRAKAEEFK